MLVELKNLDDVRLHVLDHLLAYKKKLKKYITCLNKKFSLVDLLWKAILLIGQKNLKFGK
jgi:hypothetical protein